MPIVITGNGQMQRTSDEAYSFTQESNFWYLTGLSAPDLTLVITAAETYVIAPTQTFEREAFDGALDLVAFSKRSGITGMYDQKRGWQKLRVELQRSKRVATLLSPPVYLKRHGLYTLPYRRRLIERLKRTAPGIVITDLRPELAMMRSFKQPGELQAIQKAIDITAETLADVRRPDFLKDIGHEYEIEAAISYGFRRRGANDHAFDPVVGAGAHSTTLHHMDNNGPVHREDLIVLDVGASVEHYAADITRTVSPSPLNDRKAALHKAVLEAQDYALSLIRPGIMPAEYEKAVGVFIGTKLQELGVIKQATHEDIRRHFPHATSHFLGLDTHDAGDYSSPYQAGQVITCEPGIYLPEEGIGVRIEDDVLITEAGHKVLSQACPREAFSLQS